MSSKAEYEKVLSGVPLSQGLFLSPALAIAAGAKRYFGNLCDVHPEANGERNAKSRSCVVCNKERMRERRAADPEYHRKATRAAYEKWYPKNKHKVRARKRKTATGIDAETFAALMKLQGGICAICRVGLADGDRNTHADHCHDTGKPRGILCSTCNQAEGLIRRSGLGVREFASRLAGYIENPPAMELGK